MISVSGSDISIAKGDQGTVQFSFSGAVSAGDTVKLLIAKNTWSDPLLTKEATIGSNLKASFSFTGTETSLDPAQYVYSLRLVRTNGFDTPIKEGAFVIAGVVST